MELLYYGFVALLGLLFSTKRRLIKDTKLFFVVWLTVYAGLSLIVRRQFDVDIEVYASLMSHTSLSLFYLKEPVVWLGQRYLFYYTQDTYTVFFIYDILVGVLLFKVFQNLRLPQYSFFAILIFFPFVLGMQNIYRQWVASILFLLSFSYLWAGKSTLKVYSYFALSFLSHNVAAIFFPLLFLKKKKALGKLAWFLGFFVSFAGIYFGADTKSSANTGANLSALYLALLLLLLGFVVLLDRGVIRRARKVEYKLIMGLFALSLCGTVFLASAGSERVSMFCLLIIYPFLSLLIEERFKQRVLMRIIFTVLGFIPMFMFSVSQFIMPSQSGIS